MKQPSLGFEMTQNDKRLSPRVTISMKKDFLDTVRAYAKKRRIPFSVLLRVAVAEYMERNGGAVHEL